MNSNLQFILKALVEPSPAYMEKDWLRVFGFQQHLDESYVDFRKRVKDHFIKEPRLYIREEFEESVHIVKGCTPSGNKAINIKKWTFHYNDGTKETVTMRERR